MSCEALLKKISAYIDSEIRAEDRDVIEAHLAACEHCARMAQEFRSLDDLAASEKVPPVRGEEWTRLLESVLERARRAREAELVSRGIRGALGRIAESFAARRVFARAAWALAAAAVLVVSLFAARLAFRPSSELEPRTAGGSKSPEEAPASQKRTEDFAEQRAGPAPEIVVDPEDGTVHLIYRDF